MWTIERSAEVVGGLQESADLFGEAGDPYGRAMALTTKGFAQIALEQPVEDITALLEGLRRDSARPGATVGGESRLIALGRISMAQGRLDEALQRFEASLAASEAGGDPFTETVSRHHIARLQLLRGDTDVAARGFLDTMGISMSLEHDEGIAYAIEGLCAVAALRGDAEVAATLAGAAEMTRQRITMFDTEQFIYHRRFLDAATTPANEAAVSSALARGREMSAIQAAHFALANVDGA